MVQKQLVNAAKRKHIFIKQDPRLTVSRNWRNACIWTLGACIILPFAVIFLKKTFHIDIISYSDITNASLTGLICFLISLIYTVDRYKNMEQQRQTVAQANFLAHADEQPISDGYIYSFASIPFSYKYMNIIAPFLFFFGFFIIVTIGIAFWQGFSLPFVLYVIIATIPLIVLFIKKNKYKQAELIADENGLTLKSVPANKVQYIPWHEARLFAIDSSLGEEKRKVQIPRLFELSSEQDIIRWPGASKKANGSILTMQTSLSEEEYIKQLENLHALIVQKTQLPLNDLRKQAKNLLIRDL